MVMSLPQWFDAVLQALDGGRVWCVTAEALQCLQASPAAAARSLWAEHVAAAYVVEPVRRPGLEDFVLRRR